MPTIHENHFFTVLIEFEVDPFQQETFIDAIADQVEQYFKSYGGFVSASFHANDEGQQVINYAQWNSKEDWQQSFQASNQNEAQAAIDQVISRCNAKTLRIETLRVDRIVENL